MMDSTKPHLDTYVTQGQNALSSWPNVPGSIWQGSAGCSFLASLRVGWVAAQIAWCFGFKSFKSKIL
jgi:hypothetical protein